MLRQYATMASLPEIMAELLPKAIYVQAAEKRISLLNLYIHNISGYDHGNRMDC